MVIMTTDALQIRVGRFDSGPRLHHAWQTVPHSLTFLFATAPRTLATQKIHRTAPAQRTKLVATQGEFFAQQRCEQWWFRPHDSLGDKTPMEFMPRILKPGISSSDLSN